MKFTSPALLVFLAVLISASLFLTVRSVLFGSSGFESGTLTIHSLHQPLSLDRTESGMVSIKLLQIEDYETALGFVHARDRLWQLEKMQRAVQGTQSVYAGKDFMRADLLTRLLLETGNQRFEDFFGFTAADMQRFERYAAGVNAFIDQAGRNLPMQFTISGSSASRWTAEDVAASFVLQLWLLETDWQQQLANLKVSKLLPQGLVPLLFGRTITSEFAEIDAGPAFLEQISELLTADYQLRVLLNAPRQIDPVRSIAEWHEDGTVTSLLSFQSGPGTPGFWYDAAFTGPAFSGNGIRAFTLPGTPVLWAGSTEHKSWHPVNSKVITDILYQNEDYAPSSRISVRTAEGGSMLFHLNITPDSFTMLPDQRSRFAFKRSNTQTGAIFRDYMGIGISGRENLQVYEQRHINIINTHNDENMLTQPQLQAQYPIRFSGYRSTVSDALSGQTFFGYNRLLEFSNPELLVTHKGRLQFAQNLSNILSGYTSVPSLSMAAEYLSNWDGQYNRYLTAATLTELSLFKTAENALAAYLDPEVVGVLRNINLIDPEIGVFLLNAHLTAREGASPVSNQFFARRVQEALFELESIFGPEPYAWRWGNVNKNTFTDLALCGDTQQSAFFRQRACFTLEAVRDVSILGQQDLVNAAVVYLRDGSVQTSSFTTALLQSRTDPNGNAEHVSMLIPGHSDNPFSTWFDTGMGYWPYFERFSLIPSTKTRSQLRLKPAGT
ncbi:MAG: penicillin acylase family protein [Candidatus Cyclonatronum sp.]|uniref:penicillin acylase family protein n=1 Tax=Cyclonatronum sp. TaxID=3024185 RepID=UPI0025BFB089|nr:penicillin acylase family protein [Cyclonatronum sp.]MCH8486122.1 penicillin acylase family protein [Cyclonatronum sp.]